MSNLQIDNVRRACIGITKEIKNVYKNLLVHYIVHHEGKRNEAISSSMKQIQSHPAAETAKHILRKQVKTQDSTVLGTAVARQHIFFGLATQDSVITICTLNLDQFETVKDAKLHAYHQAWHAIDAFKFHANPHNRTGASKEVIVRRRNILDVGLANLKADTFAAITNALGGNGESIKKIAYWRGMDTLSKRSLHSPERYPFPMGMDACKFAYGQIKNKSVPQKRIIPIAFRLADEVGQTFDADTLKSWIAFSEPAQEMAWRGVEPEKILSAAIYTSVNTQVRSTGHLVADVTGVDPARAFDTQEYSPFADEAYNEALHRKAVLRVFEDVIAQGVNENSDVPFLEEARIQNDALTEGHVVGWCASALQKAGEAYREAIASGVSPEEAARRGFNNELHVVPWNALENLGKKVVKTQRKGEIVTMDSLHKLAAEDESFKGIRDSIEQTISDPRYQESLKDANKLAPTTPRPQGPKLTQAPTIKGAEMKGPEPVAAAPAPAMPKAPGGGARVAPVQQPVAEPQEGAEGQSSENQAQIPPTPPMPQTPPTPVEGQAAPAQTAPQQPSQPPQAPVLPEKPPQVPPRREDIVLPQKPQTPPSEQGGESS